MASTVSGVLLTGVHASRPSSGVTAGTLYACSTHSLIYQTSDTGSTWTTWATLAGTGLSDPMTTRGDIIIRNAANTTARLGRGTATYVLTSDGTDVAWAAPAGGGSGDILPLDVPPGSAHAKDDEFPGSSLDVKWTAPITSNTGQGVTTTVASSWLTLEPTTSGSASTGKRVFGIRQASPTGSFTASAKIIDDGPLTGSNIADRSDDSRAGLWVAVGSGKAWVLGHQNSAQRIVELMGVTTYSESADWSGYDGTDQYVAAQGSGVAVGTWYRLVYDSGASTLTAYWSVNGVGWRLLNTALTSIAQPTRMGIALYANGADVNADHRLFCDWFRVTEP